MHFERIATAPGGVTQLRELILALAVRGKLVPQDPSDEPASMLLQGIRSERERLIAEGKIKRNKPLPPTTDEESPFELPQGWGWIRLGNLLRFRIGRTPPSKDPQYWSDSGYSWVSIADMDHFGVVQQTQRKLTERGAAQFGYDPLLAGTLLMSFKLTIGKIAVLGVPAYHNEAIVSFYPLAGLDTEFMKFVLPSAAKTGSSKNALMGQTLNTESLSNLILAIPPTNEQSRIVARVDELMRLCDELEAKGQLEAEQHASLLATLLGTLTDSATPEELVANWQRVAEHFDLLLDRPEAVDALEQTILQLAVRGLLVPQDPSDKPASFLLEQIRTDGNRQDAYGTLRKSPASEVGSDEVPFELPRLWAWARFGQIAEIASDLVSPAGHQSVWQIGPDCIEKGTGRLLARRTVADADVKSANHRFQPGQIIYSKIRPSLSKAVIVDFAGLCSADMYPINSKISTEYLLLVILSRCFLDQVTVAENRVKMPKLNQEALTGFHVPVPPLAEQSRIVDRVTDLRRLCADLRRRLAASHATQSRLAEAMVQSAAT
jgi:type I restriction enzyme S subunit